MSKKLVSRPAPLMMIAMFGASVLPAQVCSGYATVPARTQIAVQLMRPIDSNTSTGGGTFEARLTEPIVFEGRVLSERGSRAAVRLVNAPVAGQTAAQYSLTLAWITVEGNKYPTTTGFAEVSTPAGNDSGTPATLHLLRTEHLSIGPDVVLHFSLAELVVARPGNVISPG